MQRLPVPVLFVLLTAATPAVAQQASASAVIQIGEVLSLRTAPAPGEGGEDDRTDPGRVEVVSNVPWRLIVVVGEDGAVAGARPEAVVVARGSPGRVMLAVEPEWLDPTRQGFAPSTTLRLALARD